MTSFGTALLKSEALTRHSCIYYKLKQRDYLKLLDDELVSYMAEIYSQNLKEI